MNLDDHINKKCIALDMSCMCSPCVRAIVDPSVDENALASLIQEKVLEIIGKMLGSEMEWVIKPLEIKVNSQTEIILPKEERVKKRMKEFEDFHSLFSDAEVSWKDQLKNHPDNGKVGYWLVSGVRHSAIVKSDSAYNACCKAEEAGVGDWESPDSSFLGETMPDIVGV